MSAVTSPPPKLFTAEEFSEMPTEGCFTELVEGQVERSPLRECAHGYLCATIGYELWNHVRLRSLGRVVFGNCGVVTERGPDTVRGPDVAYYSYERVPRGPRPRGYWPAAELVVEVRSPSERTSRVMEKVGEYLAVGVRVVLVAWPEETTIMAYSEEFFNRSFGVGEDLTLPELFPEFRVPVRSLFE